MTVSAHAQPPALPDVTDEAPETASWVPWLGFALLVLAALYTVAGGTPAKPDAAAPEHAAPAAHE